jgi:hypothetical protein
LNSGDEVLFSNDLFDRREVVEGERSCVGVIGYMNLFGRDFRVSFDR